MGGGEERSNHSDNIWCREEVNLVVRSLSERKQAEDPRHVSLSFFQSVMCLLAPPALVWTWLDLSLALGYIETDKLLNASLILLLSGAAGRVLTWLSKRSLRLPHLLIHPRQTQPKGKQERKDVRNALKLQRKVFMENVFLINKHTAWLYLRWLAARLYSEGPVHPRPRHSALLLVLGISTPAWKYQRRRV